MDIVNYGGNQGSYYVNPNTRTLTSNRKNTAIKDRDNFGCMQRLLKPVENLMQAIKTPINLADRTTVNPAANSVTIAEGTQISVNDGYILTVKKNGVEVRHGADYDPYNTEAYIRAQGLADSLTTLLRNAGGTQNITAFSEEGYQKWTSEVSTVLSYMGLDGNRDFTINGMKYSKNAKGYWESAANSDAKAAYERAQAANRTYTYADERTKNQINYVSNYYLENVSVQMKTAWQKALEVTGVNPFPEGFSSTLSQLAMEQDFATGGNDDIFGKDAAGNVEAVQKIIDRIDNPLSAVSEKDQSFRADEKVFYTAVLKYMTSTEADISVRTNEPGVSKETAVSPAADTSGAAAIAGKTNIPDSKQPYTAYESANYKIEPDNENECFRIYNKEREHLGTFFYSDIKCRQDSVTGKEVLISEFGTAWYEALPLDKELKDDLQHIMGVDALEREPLRGYSLKTHAGTGIQYLIKDGEEGRGGKVLLQSEADRQKYEELVETYFNKYPNLIKSREEANIWASLEIRGMAMRTEQGIISIHYDGMSYNDNSNFQNNWSIRFQDDAYQKIFEWLEHNRDRYEDMQKFSVWKGIFDDIGIEYEQILSKTEEKQGYQTQSVTGDKAAEYAEKAFASVGSKAPAEVKKAWMDAAKETGTNGLGIAANGMITHISQMMVQRLNKWMNGSADSDDVLGSSVSSAIWAASKALYDLENPLTPENTRSIEVQRMRIKEKEFYQAFLKKLEEIPV